MPFAVYNDLSQKKEPFLPVHPPKVGIYVCGPTVYDFFHIGNSRPFIVFDVLRRYLRHRGYQVTYVQNFTDIDDKMINRATEMQISVAELAEKYIGEYFADADALGIERADVHPRATEHISEIIDSINKIIENGHAYALDGDVYFDVLSFTSYGKLIRQDLEELLSGARVNVNSRKKHPLDFALWKAEKPGEPSWESPWGKGRPGWHIECSVMSTKYLGDTIDIHGGGSDLIFPHHENEIAQAEAATGKLFVKYWMHNGYLLMDHEKMSKSLGNFRTLRDVRQQYSPLAIRHFMLSAHYRSPINFSASGLEQSAGGVERLRSCYRNLSEAPEKQNLNNTDPLKKALEKALERFYSDMDDDLNTAGALGAVFEAVKAINTALHDEGALSEENKKEALDFFHTADEVLGILDISGLLKETTPDAEDARIEDLIAQRNEARKNKDFAKADQIRDTLLEQDIVLKDSPEGTKWYRKLQS
ncbi:MAG TPA: cysteine--tRNA ligase [Synergistaceae bacterium]|nr:cysteine--tRNA ligase [Synergistaceae bacterium]HPJ25921.1 cysteine--tRNA ligase [Synergistaceae bacterium]HPQ36077.1 cysteine--tRNA ligase [Synergistaceae bacterium]